MYHSDNVRFSGQYYCCAVYFIYLMHMCEGHSTQMCECGVPLADLGEMLFHTQNSHLKQERQGVVGLPGVAWVIMADLLYSQL